MLQIPKIKGYLSAMARRGFSPQEVLQNTGITAADLEAGELQLELAQTQILIQNMLLLTGNPALGFELGNELSPADLGIVGRGMLAAPTYRDTINLWTAYTPTLYGSMLKVSIEEEHEGWHMSLRPDLPPGQCYRFCLEEYLALVINIGTQLYGAPIPYAGLDIDYPRPKHSALYEQLFGCAVRFDAGRTRIFVQTPKLSDFVQSRDEYLYSIYAKYCERQLKQTGLNSALAYKVHNYLLKTLGHTPSLEQFAANNGCSTITIKRRLQDEGVTFRKLVNQFRSDFAQEHFKSTILSAKEVGFLLGYTDTKAFLRAFKTWTGLTVGDFRQEHKNHMTVRREPAS